MNPTAALDSPVLFHPASSPDYVPREPLRTLQSQRLRQVVAQAYEHVPLFRQRMQKHGLTPADVRGVDDIHTLPFTSQGDLGDTYPLGMLAVPMQQVLRLHVAGGASGKPIVAAYTQRDLEVWAQVVIRSLVSCGIREGDVIYGACGYDLFLDGRGLDDAAATLKATVIPGCGGDAARQLMIIKDYGVSAICCTPNHFLCLIERAEKLDVDLRELPLRVGIFVAEPWSEALRQRIEASAGIKAYDVYGLAEIVGPSVGAECWHQDGVHIFEDHFFPEIVDPATGDPLPDGQEGELVLTMLSREAMPMIRYRTRDVTAILAEPCPCGRTMRRIRRVSRHREEMLVVRGVNVLPAEIEAALLAVAGTLPRYQIVLTQQQGGDQLEVQVEVTPQVFSDRVGALEALQSKLTREIEHRLGLGVAVRLVEPHSIDRGQGKAQRVVDQRGT